MFDNSESISASKLKRIKQLKEKITYYDAMYYGKNVSVIPDKEYDLLKCELESLFEDITIGRGIDADNKIRHLAPVLSLKNVYSRDQLAAFVDRIQKSCPDGNIEFVGELKVDGLTLIIKYDQHHAISFATRGDGSCGENVKANAIYIQNIRHNLMQNCVEVNDFSKFISNTDELFFRNESFFDSHDFKNFHDINSVFEVRGEVYLNKNDYIAINELCKGKFSTSRHAASGLLRQINASVEDQKKLRFMAHGFFGDFYEFTKYTQVMSVLSNCGIECVPRRICSNLTEMVEFYEHIAKIRDNLPCHIDGIVFKVNDLNLQSVIGSSGAYPRYAIAYKFDANIGVSKLINVSWQVGRTGQVTPVANIETINLGGVNISNVTLHNYQEIVNMEMKIGDYITVERAGDVIPHIIGVRKANITESNKHSDIRCPNLCPCCKTPLRYESPLLFCENPNCRDKKIASILHFVSRDAMNISGLGVKNVQYLYKAGALQSFVDIFKLNRTVLSRFWKDKSIDNLLKEIDNAKNTTFDRFLYAIGIRGVGKFTARIIANKYKSVNDFLKMFDHINQSDFVAKKEFIASNLSEIHGIGSVVANEIVAFFCKHYFDVLALLQFLSIEDYNTETLPLDNKRIAITGKFSLGSRSYILNIISKFGGIYTTTISKNTDILLTGDGDGSKLQKALKFGVQIMNENEFAIITKMLK
ncbi:NAD-dependent DNA ligase LigA [Candidatus Gromoviella agglomerans]|uniref:NAD-dependent DNA ligase LigA n=1 Tax=Candidatus Gromoviella agglomerans TaxID=2806609 RepID=UPI001E5C747C|nr:NAD-dependent DNA ligase LigA [Candidatus Gromoviella agglomerans]UFX98400.1 DNA ligase [Candidatus Gromoviella agglomerans]